MKCDWRVMRYDSVNAWFAFMKFLIRRSLSPRSSRARATRSVRSYWFDGESIKVCTPHRASAPASRVAREDEEARSAELTGLVPDDQLCAVGTHCDESFCSCSG